MKTLTKRISLLLLATALWSLASTSCNTLQGIGEDIEGAGRKLKESAR